MVIFNLIIDFKIGNREYYKEYFKIIDLNIIMRIIEIRNKYWGLGLRVRVKDER